MSLSKEHISQYFHMPMHQAAEHLNISLTGIKRKCREVGIQRWPYRKLISLQKLINDCQVRNKLALKF